MQALGIFAGRWSDFMVYKLPNHHSGNIALDQQALYSLSQWRNVKIWDIIHSRGWESMGKRFFKYAESVDNVWPDSHLLYTSPNFTMPDRDHLMNLRDASYATFVAVDQEVVLAAAGAQRLPAPPQRGDAHRLGLSGGECLHPQPFGRRLAGQRPCRS
jgi:hypothetical protein